MEWPRPSSPNLDAEPSEDEEVELASKTYRQRLRTGGEARKGDQTVATVFPVEGRTSDEHVNR